jgi:negative regulator of flagellin synthesis FlgM
MKIDKATPPLPASQIGELAPKSANAKPSGGTNTANGNIPSETRVHLGTSSVQLRNLESSIANTSVVNKEKVEEIKKAISEGRFQVNAGVVADGLIDSVKDLINSNKSGAA